MAASRHGRRVGAAAVGLAGVALQLSAAGLLAHQSPLPDGRGKAEFQRVCAGCHPAEDAVKGVRRSREGWQQVVDDMVVRGAEGSDEELKLVVDYLTERFGPSSGRPPELGTLGVAPSVRHEGERGIPCGISRSRWPR